MNRDELPQMAAAGGLVLSGGHALLIRKHHLWDLPKGKLAGEEDPSECAVREISEETGLSPDLLSIRAPLCPSSYISWYSYGPVYKTVNWFLIDYAGDLTDRLTPELTEDIDLCRWVPLDDLLDSAHSAREYLRPVWDCIEQALFPSPAVHPRA